MPRYFFDVQDGSGVFIDQTGTELPGDGAAQEEASAAIASIARDQISHTTKSENIVMWVRRERGGALVVLTLSFMLLATAASHGDPVLSAERKEL